MEFFYIGDEKFDSFDEAIEAANKRGIQKFESRDENGEKMADLVLVGGKNWTYKF